MVAGLDPMEAASRLSQFAGQFQVSIVWKWVRGGWVLGGCGG